jgi:hypothetical protein
MMPFLRLGDVKNCQLPSSNNQNKTSRYSPLFEFVDSPGIPFSSWMEPIGLGVRQHRFMQRPASKALLDWVALRARGVKLVIAVGRLLFSAEAPELVQ